MQSNVSMAAYNRRDTDCMSLMEFQRRSSMLGQSRDEAQSQSMCDSMPP